MLQFSPEDIKCIIFDFADTLYSGSYFNIFPCGCENWRQLFNTYIFDKDVIELKAMNGELTTEDIAAIVSGHVGLGFEEVLQLAEDGCGNLEFNSAVLKFAIEQKIKGTATSLVTINMDVFTKVVVPAHGLSDIFDVIVNSFDHKEMKKEILLDIAFDQLGAGITFSNSLLIDDIADNVKLFEERGGYAYQYKDDKSFTKWLNSTGFWTENG